MALRQNPETYFAVRSQRLQVEEPPSLQIPEYSLSIDPNIVLAVLGVVAVVGLIGLFAIIAGGQNKCR